MRLVDIQPEAGLDPGGGAAGLDEDFAIRAEGIRQRGCRSCGSRRSGWRSLRAGRQGRRCVSRRSGGGRSGSGDRCRARRRSRRRDRCRGGSGGAGRRSGESGGGRGGRTVAVAVVTPGAGEAPASASRAEGTNSIDEPTSDLLMGRPYRRWCPIGKRVSPALPAVGFQPCPPSHAPDILRQGNRLRRCLAAGGGGGTAVAFAAGRIISTPLSSSNLPHRGGRDS